MATVADHFAYNERRPDVLSGTPRAHALDRWIFVVMAVWYIVITLTGFIPDSIMKVGMIQAGQRPPFPIVLHMHAVLMGSFLLLLAQSWMMATGRNAQHVKLGERLRCILNFADETLEAGQLSRVTDLPAALAVEGRLVEQDLHRLADLGVLDASPVFDDREHDTLAFVARIAGELGRSMLLSEVEPDVLAGLGARALPGSTRFGLLLGHRRIEATLVNLQALFDQRLLGEVDREAVGVVELERDLA